MRSQNKPDLGIYLVLSIFYISAIWVKEELLSGNQWRFHHGCIKTCCLRSLIGADCRIAPSRNHRPTGRIWRGLDSDCCTFCPEVEERCELPALVVAPEEVDCVLEPDLEGEDQGEYLDGEAAAIDVVSQEEVLGWFECASRVLVDDLHEIVELPVNIANDGHWILYSD